MQVLSLQHCPKVTGEGLAVLASLPDLSSLSLASCPQIGSGKTLAKLTQLRSLDLSWCRNVSDTTMSIVGPRWVLYLGF